MRYYACCSDDRRAAVRASAALNGIDFVEVVDHDAVDPADRQRVLRVHFLKPAPAGLTRDNVVISGGDRIRGVTPDRDPSVIDGDVVELHLDRYGDYSTYTLGIVRAGTDDVPLDGLDPLMWQTPFWFKVECPSPFDCRPRHDCSAPPPPSPAIDYLAKDCAGFRRLMLDRMSALMPAWTERRAADFGVTAVEVLAYVADRLSYQQDAIATEAYLGTARRRVSLRRHARLVDYAMHDGCNARTWVHFDVTADAAIGAGRQVVTRLPGQAVVIDPDPKLLRQGQVFELMAGAQLRVEHNRFGLYTWGERDCCLPKGAVRATLHGHFPHLAAGDVLIFMEVMGPRTGRVGDADLAKRHAVWLTDAIATTSAGEPLRDPLTTELVTQIAWHEADRLPFPVCVSSTADEEHGSAVLSDVSIVLGNNVPADHGWRQPPEALGTVPPGLIRHQDPRHCATGPAAALPARFNPVIVPLSPITQASAYDASRPASQALAQDLRAAVPQIELQSTVRSQSDTWTAQRDLLASHAADTHFVVEVETDGSAAVRFGDDRHGKRPEAGTAFEASFRIGNGAAGNIGADTLYHLVDPFPVERVTNPLSAVGGVEAETAEHVRRAAPQAFRTQRRAVTPKDYAARAMEYPGVQRAAATLRFTGSWYTVCLTIDRQGYGEMDDDFRDGLTRHMNRFRMAGYDLEIDNPRRVSLDIAMQVCVKPDYFRSDVEHALLETFSSRTLRDGRRGVFHPDNFTFEQPVYLSAIYAAAQAVEGVALVRVTRFQRQGSPESSALDSGKLPIGRLEIARLDADPDFPDRGTFELVTAGGK